MKVFKILFFLALASGIFALGRGQAALAQTCQSISPSQRAMGEMSFPINVPEDGDYIVSIRMKAADSQKNSLFLKVDDNCPIIVGDSGNISSSNWSFIDYSGNTDDKLQFNLNEGQHLITLTGREDGVKVDRVALKKTNESCMLSQKDDICVTVVNPTQAPSSAPTRTPTPKPMSTTIDSSYACSGFTGTTIPPNGNYKTTAFGCVNGWTDPGDNCLPACGNPPGLCNGLSGPDCERKLGWFAADADRYGCFSRLKITNPITKKAAVVIVIDRGPACSQEQIHKAPIIDLSYTAAKYVGGTNGGNYEVANVEKVSNTTPLGPVTATSTPTPIKTPTPSPTKKPAITPTRTPTPSKTPKPTITGQTPSPTEPEITQADKPTPTPIRRPTSTPIKSTPVPTRTPTPTRIATPTVIVGLYSIELDTYLHGIGRGGDTLNPQGTGNQNPITKSVDVSVEIVKPDDQSVVKNATGKLNFDSVSGSYKGLINLGNSLPNGSYKIRVLTPGYLKNETKDEIVIKRSSTATPQSIFLVTGDTDTNNVLDILDYNNILSCFGQKRTGASCILKDTTDLDDDGKIDGIDYNLLLREIKGITTN